MIATMRTKFGPIVIGSIIGLIAFVFIFYGIFMPGSGGGNTPNVAGEVNGETISYSEFSKALNQRVEYFKSMMGGNITEEQLAQFKVREAVFQDLAQRKLTVQIAKKEGFYPSAEEVRDRILSMDAFKKDGHFDKVHYKAVLTQNQYTPTRFEELIAQDLIEQEFKAFLSSLAILAPDSVDKELKSTKEKRKVRYAYLDHEAIRKALPKDLKPDGIKAELDKKVELLSKELLPLVTSGKEKNIETLLKPFNLKMKTSDWLNSQADFIGGVGSIRSIRDELYAFKKGASAKSFPLIGGTLVATVADAEYYDPSKITAKDRTETRSKLQYQRQNALTGELIKYWTKKATINRNDTVVVGGKGTNVPITLDQ